MPILAKNIVTFFEVLTYVVSDLHLKEMRQTTNIYFGFGVVS